MKKNLLFLIALLTFSLPVYADDKIEVFEDGDWLYCVNRDADFEVTVVQYQRENPVELTIPSYATYDGSVYSVTALGENLFSEYSNEEYWNEGNDSSFPYTKPWSHGDYPTLEKVTIPNSVTIIKQSAFDDCSGLKWVSIPNSVTVIGTMAFYYCPCLTAVDIPDSVTEIGNYAFLGCSGMTSLSIGGSVTKIGSEAFYGCSGLHSVTIPGGMTEIGSEAFANCQSLTSICVAGDSREFSSVDGVLFNKDQTILKAFPAGKDGVYRVPDTVTEIEYGAFCKCSGLTSVEIPNSVTEIGGRAFYDCTGLTSVTLPASLTAIWDNTFGFCSGLTSITIPNSVTHVAEMAFYFCSNLMSVTIGTSVTDIAGRNTFVGCNGLRTIYALPSVPPTVNPFALEYLPADAVVYVPKGALYNYIDADGWNWFTDFRELGAPEIMLSQTELALEAGDSETITATVETDVDVIVESESWTTSNPEVATVEAGVVTAIGEGEASITFTVIDGYGISYNRSCVVTVTTQSGIEGVIAADENAPVEYYNLNGVRVNGDVLAPGLYIKRHGGTTSKVFVK